MKSIVYGVLFLFLLTGCASKVHLTKLNQAKLTQETIKALIVFDFKNDTVAQKSAIQTALLAHKINQQPYFTLLEREDLQTILEEKEFNELRESLRQEPFALNTLQKADAILQGDVIEASMHVFNYLKPIVDTTRCIEFNAKKECISFYKEIQRCQKNHYTLQTAIKITDINSATILFSKLYTKEDVISKCSATFVLFPKKSVHLHLLAQHIAKELIDDIAPHYTNYSVEIIQKLDIKVNKKEEELFEKAVELLIQNQFKQAQTLFLQLHVSMQDTKSVAILYNLALSFEAQKQYQQALHYYNEAMQYSKQSNSLLLSGIQRMKKQIEQNLL
jgi:tetratricopeptide (TPR) repeat protein